MLEVSGVVAPSARSKSGVSSTFYSNASPVITFLTQGQFSIIFIRVSSLV
jgi:hypothetical protein